MGGKDQNREGFYFFSSALYSFYRALSFPDLGSKTRRKTLESEGKSYRRGKTVVSSLRRLPLCGLSCPYIDHFSKFTPHFLVVSIIFSLIFLKARFRLHRDRSCPRIRIVHAFDSCAQDRGELGVVESSSDSDAVRCVFLIVCSVWFLRKRGRRNKRVRFSISNN